MPYPATVSLDANNGIGNTVSGQYGFEYAGNQYLFLIDQDAGVLAPFHIRAYKSIDDGLSWTELDSANAPSVTSALNFSPCFTATPDDAAGLAHVLMVRATTTLGVTTIDGTDYKPFNLATGTWGVTVVGIGITLDFMGRGNVAQTSRLVGLQLLVRGPGDYVLYYSGPQVTPSPKGRPYTADFDGTTVSNIQGLPDMSATRAYIVRSAAIDSNSLTHFIYHTGSGPFTGFGFDVYHVTMDAAGVFGATQLVTDDLYLQWNAGQISNPIIFDLNGVETVAIGILLNDDAGSTTQSLAVMTAPATAAPVWTQSTVVSAGALPNALPGVPGFFLTPQSISIAVANDTLVATWINNEDGDTGGDHDGKYYYATSPIDVLAWTAPAVLWIPGMDAIGEVMAAYQVVSWSMTNGVGVFGFSNSVNFLAEFGSQFALVGIEPPPPEPTTVPIRVTLWGVKRRSLQVTSDLVVTQDSPHVKRAV